MRAQGEPEPTAASGPFWAEAPNEVRLAAVLIALQAVGLLATAVVLVVKIIVGDPESLGRAALDVGFVLGSAALLLFGGRSLLLLSPSARTPVIVLEVLALPVGYSLGFQAGRMLYGAPIMVSALAVLYLLFTPKARAALDREL